VLGTRPPHVALRPDPAATTTLHVLSAVRNLNSGNKNHRAGMCDRFPFPSCASLSVHKCDRQVVPLYLPFLLWNSYLRGRLGGSKKARRFPRTTTPSLYTFVAVESTIGS
jgi:hypothetical protein